MSIIPLLNLKAQYATIRDEIRAAVDRVLESQHFILGPEVEALEAEIAKYSQCQFGIGVSSGSDALLVSLMALELKPGDEVITSPYTFFATVGAIVRLGAKPVFVDIDPATYNLDFQSLENAVGPRTRAVLPVHLFGQMAEMDPILEFARRHNLSIIEDAAQAIGSEYRNRRAGSIGHLGCFSFFPSKNLGGFGDGGMVTTSDSDLADKIRILRSHGSRPKYYHQWIGGNFRLDALQAAVLRVKLKYLEEWTERRRQNATLYRRLFRESGIALSEQPIPQKNEIALPFESQSGRHIYNQFTIRCQERDRLMKHLSDRGIMTEVYYPLPMHRQKCFENLEYSSFPQSEAAARESLSLPIYPELTSDMIHQVVSAIAEFFQIKN